MPATQKKKTPTKGELKRTAILDSAMQLLIEGGFAGLSFRKVAQRANVQTGNLQFYFPTRSELVKALLTRETERYRTALSELTRANTPHEPEEALSIAVDYLLEDQTSQASCILFWELWALAAHDIDAANVMRYHYDEFLHEASQMIRRIRPELSKARGDQAAVLVISLIEGLSLFRGYQKHKMSALHRSQSATKTAIKAIIQEA